MTNNYSRDDNANHAKRVTEGELEELVGTRRENVKNNKVMDGVMYCDLTEYYIHLINNTINQ